MFFRRKKKKKKRRVTIRAAFTLEEEKKKNRAGFQNRSLAAIISSYSRYSRKKRKKKKRGGVGGEASSTCLGHPKRIGIGWPWPPKKRKGRSARCFEEVTELTTGKKKEKGKGEERSMLSYCRQPCGFMRMLKREKER